MDARTEQLRTAYDADAAARDREFGRDRRRPWQAATIQGAEFAGGQRDLRIHLRPRRDGTGTLASDEHRRLMPSAPKRSRADQDAEALESVRGSLPEPDDEDLVEHRQDEPPEELQQPLHDPWWAGGSGGGGV